MDTNSFSREASLECLRIKGTRDRRSAGWMQRSHRLLVATRAGRAVMRTNQNLHVSQGIRVAERLLEDEVVPCLLLQSVIMSIH